MFGARRRSLIATGLAAVLASMGGVLASTSMAARPSRPLALVYRGPAACSGCAEAVATLLRRSPLHFRVGYIGPHERRRLTAAGLRGVALYAQPGGNDDVASATRQIGRSEIRALRAYVAGGGRYLGFCMGAYLAGSDPGIGLLSPGNTGEYDHTRGALVTTSAEAVIPIRWGARVYDALVQDPPYMTGIRVRGERVLSRFTNGTINALVQPFGHGRVGVVGSHPEADRSWYTPKLWHADHDGLDYRHGLELIAATMASS